MPEDSFYESFADLDNYHAVFNIFLTGISLTLERFNLF